MFTIAELCFISKIIPNFIHLICYFSSSHKFHIMFFRAEFRIPGAVILDVRFKLSQTVLISSFYPFSFSKSFLFYLGKSSLDCLLKEKNILYRINLNKVFQTIMYSRRSSQIFLLLVRILLLISNCKLFLFFK